MTRSQPGSTTGPETDPMPRQPADRRQLQQIIAELPQGVIIIEPDQTIAWCNDAALAMHNVGSLQDLGDNVSQYRQRFELRTGNRRKLPQADPRMQPGVSPIDRLVAGEGSTEVTVEVACPGDPRPRVQQIRSLVINDAAGQPDCLVLVIEDQTERYDAEERFEDTFAANPAPAIIARLADLRYVKVNQGFLEMTGYHEGALIGRSMHEVDVLERADHRAMALAHLHAGTTIPQMEACLSLPSGIEKTVIVAGHPIEVADQACMLFTFADLHPRTLAEHALRQSEQRFSAAFRLAPVPMAIAARDGIRLLDVNEAFTAVTGWRREEAIGRTGAELALWSRPGGSQTDGNEAPASGSRRGAAKTPVVTAAADALAHLIAQTPHLRGVEVQLRTRSGRLCACLLSAETVTIHEQPCVLAVLQDITERKQTETQLLAAVESVMRDTSWFGQQIVEKLASLTSHGVPDRPGPKVADLTPRGQEVLGLIAQGLADGTIADRLGVNERTVRNHVSAIYKVVGVRRRSALVLWAREHGLGGAAKPAEKQRDAKRRRAVPA